ncbi:mucin-13-like, partial [Planoprotostelium fungivorum]
CSTADSLGKTKTVFVFSFGVAEWQARHRPSLKDFLSSPSDQAISQGFSFQSVRSVSQESEDEKLAMVLRVLRRSKPSMPPDSFIFIFSFSILHQINKIGTQILPQRSEEVATTRKPNQMFTPNLSPLMINEYGWSVRFRRNGQIDEEEEITVDHGGDVNKWPWSSKILQDHIFTSGYYFQVKRLATSCRSTSIVLNTLRTVSDCDGDYETRVQFLPVYGGDKGSVHLQRIGGPWMDPSVYNPNCGLKPDVDKHSDTRLFPQRFEGKEEETFRYERDTSLVRDIIDFWKRVASTVPCDKRIPHMVGDPTMTGGGKNKTVYSDTHCVTYGKEETLNNNYLLPEGQPPTRAPAKKSATDANDSSKEEEAKPDKTSDSDKDSPLGSRRGHKGHHSPELKARTASSTTTATRSTRSTSKQALPTAIIFPTGARTLTSSGSPDGRAVMIATTGQPGATSSFWAATGFHAQPLTRPSATKKKRTKKTTHSKLAPCPLTRPSATKKKRTKKTTHSKLAPCVMCLSEMSRIDVIFLDSQLRSWISHADFVEEDLSLD